MERKKASDFPQELLNLFDGYVHGGIQPPRISRRRAKICRRRRDRGGALGDAEAELRLGDPGPAGRQPDQGRIATVPSPQGNGSIKGYLVRPANADGKLPAVLVVHENRGLNPYIEDVARRLAVAELHRLRARRADLASAAIRATTRRARSCSARSIAPR